LIAISHKSSSEFEAEYPSTRAPHDSQDNSHVTTYGVFLNISACSSGLMNAGNIPPLTDRTNLSLPQNGQSRKFSSMSARPLPLL
jgi:hypothetical protein